MTRTNFQQWLASGLLLGSILTLAILTGIPQPQADALIYIGLAAGFLLALASFITFLNLQIRRALNRGYLDELQIGPAFRQGIEVAFFIVGGLYLRAFNGLGLLEASFLATTILFAEVALSLRKNPFAH